MSARVCTGLEKLCGCVPFLCTGVRTATKHTGLELTLSVIICFALPSAESALGSPRAPMSWIT